MAKEDCNLQSERIYFGSGYIVYEKNIYHRTNGFAKYPYQYWFYGIRAPII